MSEAKDDDARKRKVLTDFYTEAEDFLNTMDEQITNLVQRHAGNIEENMKNHKEQLEQKQYFLLVAGKCNQALL